MRLASLADHVLLLLLLLLAVLVTLRRELLIPSRRARWALRAGFLVWALLWASATPAVAVALARALEPAAPTAAAAVPPALRAQTALVVLGSSVNPARPGEALRERLDGAGRARTLGAARWYAQTQPAAVIVSGVGPADEPTASARAMADALASEGVPPDRIWLEPRATDTRDNARYSVELGRPRGITRFVVVTSALHMPRALAEFRRAGVSPVAAPVEYVGAARGGVADYIPSAGSLGRTQQCLHELLGRLKP